MVTQKVFDKLSNGCEIIEFILDNGVIEARILNYGCIIQSLFVADKDGVKRDVVLGYDKAIGYEINGVLARRYEEKSPIPCHACSGFSRQRPRIVPKILKIKWGWIWLSMSAIRLSSSSFSSLCA